MNRAEVSYIGLHVKDEADVRVNFYDAKGSTEAYVSITIDPASFFLTPRAARNLVQKLAALHQAAVEEHVTRSLTGELTA